MQAATTYLQGDIPFYDLAMLGGENRMRGYYKGALRDKVLFDTQVEYRMPVWKIFGVVGWVATGRVADAYKNLNFDGNGFWLSYGGGLRIQVDGDNNINLRVDMGFGPGGISGLYLNFAEAF
jgi:outer membrane protein assembly factor BamA